MWTIYILTDTGRLVPHWSEPSRQRIISALGRLRAAYPRLTVVCKRRA